MVSEVNRVIKNSIRLSLSIIISLSLVVFLRAVVMEPRQVRQRSMLPTLWDGDIILVGKNAYIFGQPGRGDVVVFKSPNGKEDLVKRVVGIPGDWIKDNGSKLLVNGFVLDKGRTKSDEWLFRFDKKTGDQQGRGIHLGTGEFYVVGDNRDVSRDSRAFGPIKRESIIGRVLLVVWPPEHLSVLN